MQLVAWLPPFLAALVWSTRVSSQAIPDNRCYLENGAPTESFFVNEDLKVGSTIGQVRIHGDPRPGGNIGLHLQETDSPIGILPGTKNLTLLRRLDKEGVDGPSSVFVNLICDRLHNVDPGFVIPINIRVTDANDNAPRFINAPYVLNISEVTVVGTRVLQGVRAEDLDQQGPFSNVRYSVLRGPHSDYFDFENELEGTLVLRKPLDYETLKSFSVAIRAQDHGDPPKFSDTVLTVFVVDADDQNPKFLDERYMAQLADVVPRGTLVSIQPRDIKAVDQDSGINAPVFYAFNGVGHDYSLFKIGRDSGRITLARDLTEGDLQHQATLVIRATQQDNPDRYALATLTVIKGGERSVRFMQHVFYVRAPESVTPGSTLTTLTTNRPRQSLRYYVSEQALLKVFSISPRGELALRQALDYEDRPEYVFRVFTTDGVTNDSCVVNVTVEDVNEWEPRFRYPHYEFFISGTPGELVGRIEAADGDRGDSLTLSLIGVNASMFSITANGELFIRESAPVGSVANFAVVATDSGDPPKRASVAVTVHFPAAGAVGIASGRNSGGAVVLAGLGVVLLILAFIIALLVTYICKAKRTRPPTQIQSLRGDKSSSLPNMIEKISNPMFATRSPTATAMGGLPAENMRSKIPSPKVHPAPAPPMWPHNGIPNRVKKLSWGDDKTDSDSTDNLNNIDTSHRLSDNSNLTVYF